MYILTYLCISWLSATWCIIIKCSSLTRSTTKNLYFIVWQTLCVRITDSFLRPLNHKILAIRAWINNTVLVKSGMWVHIRALTIPPLWLGWAFISKIKKQNVWILIHAQMWLKHSPGYQASYCKSGIAYSGLCWPTFAGVFVIVNDCFLCVLHWLLLNVSSRKPRRWQREIRTSQL